MTDEQLIEAMARAVSVKRMGTDENWQLYVVDQSAALAAQRETHHLIPRAAGDDGELVKRLRYTYEHGIFVAAENGMLAGADEAADRITALSAEVERLRAWQNAALEVEPNIDLDIEQLGAKP
jgi:hypothetical protein